MSEPSRERAKETLKQRYGEDYFREIGRKSSNFKNPDILKKALATRKRNKELRDAQIPDNSLRS